MSAGVYARSGRMCHSEMSKEKSQRKVDQWMWMTSCTGSARRILGDLTKSVSWVENWTPNEKGRLSFARGGALRVPHEMGVAYMEKPEEKECVSLSLCRRTFKLKGNNKFRTWTKKSLHLFRVSGLLCSMLYMNEHSMSISHVSGYLAMYHLSVCLLTCLFLWITPKIFCFNIYHVAFWLVIACNIK